MCFALDYLAIMAPQNRPETGERTGRRLHLFMLTAFLSLEVDSLLLRSWGIKGFVHWKYTTVTEL